MGRIINLSILIKVASSFHILNFPEVHILTSELQLVAGDACHETPEGTGKPIVPDHLAWNITFSQALDDEPKKQH